VTGLHVDFGMTDFASGLFSAVGETKSQGRVHRCVDTFRQTGAAVEAGIRRGGAEVSLNIWARAIDAGGAFHHRAVDEEVYRYNSLIGYEGPTCKLDFPIEERKPINTRCQRHTSKPSFPC
jgi:hypothetical protein